MQMQLIQAQIVEFKLKQEYIMDAQTTAEAQLAPQETKAKL